VTPVSIIVVSALVSIAATLLILLAFTNVTFG
jgi:hypothetical protein